MVHGTQLQSKAETTHKQDTQHADTLDLDPDLMTLTYKLYLDITGARYSEDLIS